MSRKRRLTSDLHKSRDQLILDNLPLARWHASRRRCAGSHISYEDLYQAACIGLIKAADTWDGRGDLGPFSAWATIKIKAEIGEELRRTRHLIRIPRREQPHIRKSLSDEWLNEEPSEPAIDIHDQITEMLRHLSNQSRLILALHFGLLDGSPWPSTHIARKLGVSHSTVDNRLRDALSRLKMIADRA